MGNRTQSTDVVSLDAGNWPSASVVSSTVTTPGSVDESSNHSSRSVSSSGNKLVHQVRWKYLMFNSYTEVYHCFIIFQVSTTSNSASSNEGVSVNSVAAAGDMRIGTVTPPSTDSSVVDDEVKKRRRKLHFPFGKRSKNKGSSASAK